MNRDVPADDTIPTPIRINAHDPDFLKKMRDSVNGLDPNKYFLVIDSLSEVYINDDPVITLPSMGDCDGFVMEYEYSEPIPIPPNWIKNAKHILHTQQTRAKAIAKRHHKPRIKVSKGRYLYLK